MIGAGYIGLEMASVWGRLGAKITVIEFLDRIVPGMDGELAAQFQKLLRRQKMKFKLSTKVTGAELTDSGVPLTMEPAAGGGRGGLPRPLLQRHGPRHRGCAAARVHRGRRRPGARRA